MDWSNYSVDGQISMFDLTNDKANQRKKSTDWKWSFKDYPEKNGLKAFSCFACGGVAQWDISYLVLMLSVVAN